MIEIAQSINKNEVNELPIERFEGRIIEIDKKAKVKAAVEYLKKSEAIGFDTETRPSFKKGVTFKVALLQLSTDDTCFLFRLNRIGFPQELRTLLQNTKVKKIALSSQDDIAGLKKRSDFRPANFIELQKMVKEYGIADQSLQKIYAILFDKKISKSQRLSNWESAILTEKQKTYAATDAWTTLRIYEKLININPKDVVTIVKEDENEMTQKTLAAAGNI
ncbi:MAG: 3'-5' exonuclease domain-containing protein 2 [Paludibacteraceae bacterium]|nr:3'-5' exonuclease domain-containing protein 2 [Paludibacteraceae bacterium]